MTRKRKCSADADGGDVTTGLAANYGPLFLALGLLDFARLRLPSGPQGLAALLAAGYDPATHVSTISGVHIAVSRDALASALSLPMCPTTTTLDTKIFEDELNHAAIASFVSQRMIRDEDGSEVDEVVEAMRQVHESKAHLVDWAGVLWAVVERELLAAKKAASSTQKFVGYFLRLIESQNPDLLQFFAVQDAEEEERCVLGKKRRKKKKVDYRFDERAVQEAEDEMEVCVLEKKRRRKRGQVSECGTKGPVAGDVEEKELPRKDLMQEAEDGRCVFQKKTRTKNKGKNFALSQCRLKSMKAEGLEEEREALWQCGSKNAMAGDLEGKEKEAAQFASRQCASKGTVVSDLDEDLEKEIANFALQKCDLKGPVVGALELVEKEVGDVTLRQCGLKGMVSVDVQKGGHVEVKKEHEGGNSEFLSAACSAVISSSEDKSFMGLLRVHAGFCIAGMQV